MIQDLDDFELVRLVMTDSPSAEAAAHELQVRCELYGDDYRDHVARMRYSFPRGKRGVT